VGEALSVPRRTPRFYYGWWIVFASASIVFLSAGTFFYGFGLLVGPLTQEFGWSRAALSAAFSLRTEVGGIAAPIVGFTVDRVGVRRLVIIGVWIVAAGIILLSQTQSLWGFYVAVTVIAMGNTLTGGATATVAIAHWFHRKRGRALGLMTLGGGMSGSMAIIFAVLISNFGWREALVIVGIAQLVVCTPLALSIRNKPEDMGLPVDGFGSASGEEASMLASSAATSMSEGYTSKEALKSSLFWRIAITFALANLASIAIIVHQVPFLTESVGLSEGFAAATVTIMTGISLIGRLGFGSAADFIPKRAAAAVALVLLSLSLVLFATVHHAWQLVYVLPLFGLGFGGIIPVRSSLQAEYFGLKAFGAIQGMALTVITLGAFFGPILAGWMYDVTGSYRTAFALLALGPLLAAPLILSAKPRPPAQ